MPSSYKLPWFKFFATDWLTDLPVRLMSSRQKGWYIDLLCWAWQEGGIRLATAKRMLSDTQATGERQGSDGERCLQERENIDREMQEVLSHFTVKVENGLLSHPKLEQLR